MKLGDIFFQSKIEVTIAEQNPAWGKNYTVSGRKAKQGVEELLGQSAQFFKGVLGK